MLEIDLSNVRRKMTLSRSDGFIFRKEWREREKGGGGVKTHSTINVGKILSGMP